MFTNKPKNEDSGLQKTIDALFVELSFRSGDEDEYAKVVDQLSKLYSLKEIDSKKRVSPDTLAMIAANIAGIVLIVGHERAHVVTSKAVSFIWKLR